MLAADDMGDKVMADFKAGDVVMLRSGGPYMTVSFIAEKSAEAAAAGDLVCQWFDGPVLYKGMLHPCSVRLVEEPVAVPNDPEE
jgi:uncharacterized protein YodC (DUF2158 family)